MKAASESQLDDRIDEIDYLLVGPHLSYMLDDLKKQVEGKNIEVLVIPQKIYGSLNGNAALELILNLEN